MRARRPGLSPAALAGAALVVAGLACGDVPTLPDGVAYISSVILPSPAVALGDTLRDSMGVVTPLKLFGIDDAGDTVRTLTPVFIVTTVPGKSVRITSTQLVIGDSIRTAQIVGQVGTRLQTPPALLDVVNQPDSIAASSATSARFPAPTATEVTSTVTLGVSVTSPPTATAPRAGVKSIIVRYLVTRIFPASATIPDTTLVLVDDGGRFRLPTGRASTDTTDAAGSASRRIRAIPLGFDSVEISASATNLKGVPLKGSPIRFMATTK
ncbi:MAG: hypothetical protein ACJ79A_01375 [Gemmatimonadaceae bacterium]